MKLKLVGWKPVDEAQPVMNLELISALANLAPGEIHELHPASDSHPGIVVHICEEQGTDELVLDLMIIYQISDELFAASFRINLKFQHFSSYRIV